VSLSAPAATRPPTIDLPVWERSPAAQQPQWWDHPAYERCRRALASAEPLVPLAELVALRRALAAVAAGQASLLQIGDCAERFEECTPWHTSAKLATIHLLADRLELNTGRPVVRVGRIGGQFAKPRSQPTERVGDAELPVFRGHLVNSEVASVAARRHDPQRMLRGYEASSDVLRAIRTHRGPLSGGPWVSHEALVMDYEGPLVRIDAATGVRFLSSTHLPWVGERTRQPDFAQVQLLASVHNPVGFKFGPTAGVDDVLRLCEVLDPDRTPGRLVLIARIGRRVIADALPPIVAAVRQAGHPVVWLCDPMHANTVSSDAGVKTRHLEAIIDEARMFAQVVAGEGAPPGGLHLEVAATDVTECVGGGVTDGEGLRSRYTTLCDPRLNPDQARMLLDAWR
jgi:3-deoxy-7-phosphoheptulonate synthase